MLHSYFRAPGGPTALRRQQAVYLPRPPLPFPSPLGALDRSPPELTL
jgi:hypothetical protein